MAKFEVSWTEEIWHRAVVEADSPEEAEEILWSGQMGNIAPDSAYGAEIQEWVDIEEVV